MNLERLDYFVHVAALGRFSMAALVLDIAQPTLSRPVRALEIDPRATLLLRNGRGVVLTDAGRAIVDGLSSCISEGISTGHGRPRITPPTCKPSQPGSRQP